MTDFTPEHIRDAVRQYRWYHKIQLTDDLATPPAHPEFQPVWDLILSGLESVDFRGKRVLDIGCRDGCFSFLAERRGAREVIAFDNNLSLGAVEFLIPFFRSGVQMHALNLYDLTPERWGQFDIICFFGVLYHLRYPVWALKKIIDCLADGGLLLLESGMLVEERLSDYELLYCPVAKSPYEPTSCTFFNEKGLCTTLQCFGCQKLVSRRLCESGSVQPIGAGQRGWRAIQRWLQQIVRPETSSRPPSSLAVDRQFFLFRKEPLPATGPSAFLQRYWDGAPKKE
jgi:SAM-dependent methyltransferase